MSESAKLLECRHLSKSYASQEGQPVRILHELDFEIDTGQSAAVVGPSGCGKSTLLNLIGTLDQPDGGEILFQGEDITQFDDRRRAHFRNRDIGFVFQEHHLLPQCSVLENVLLPVMAPGSPLRGQDAKARANQLLDQVGLAHRATHRPAQLSGGERQRVAVARALIHGPRLLLADEPTGSLDRDTAHQLADLLCDLVQEHDLALMVVTHSESLAGRMSRCYQLLNGKLSLHQDVAS